MNRLSFPLLITSTLVAAFTACGGISDPTRQTPGGGVAVATVSGALTGTSVPANAHVALVWRKGVSMSSDGVVVGADVPVVNGKFTMDLTIPDAELFGPVKGNGWDDGPDVITPGNSGSDVGGGGVAGGVPGPPPVPGDGEEGAPAFNTKLTPRGGTVSGGITEPLSAAVAGFIVYADANGNGVLDLEGSHAGSPDQILGGNRELILAYLKDGGALDYEKLRDKSGILPTTGFNLAWSEGRWLPLNVVELQLSADAKLPGAVCASHAYPQEDWGNSAGIPKTEPKPSLPPSEEPADPEPAPSGPGSTPTPPGGYPLPGDPNLHCDPNGYGFTYSGTSSCPPYVPPPVGLCSGNWAQIDLTGASPGCARLPMYRSTMDPDSAPPAGWPCPVAPVALPIPDAGTLPVPDAGK